MRPPFPSVLDNTTVNAFRSCPRSAYLSYFEHWKPQSTSVHLHAGAAFASGLEAARHAYYSEGLDSETAVARGLKTLLAHYGDFSPPAESAKSPERMAQALEYYFEAFPLDSDPAQPYVLPSGKRAIEFSFAVPLPVEHPETGEPIIYAGRADMVCTFNGGIFIEDDKTASSLGPQWSSQWDLRSQFTGYAWAAHTQGIPVDGVLVRGVAILKTLFKHEQYLTYRPEWQIHRWLDQTCRDIERMKRSWAEGHFDYNLGEACSSYGGCSFRQVCQSPNPHEWLEMYFERRAWNPVTRMETLL